jgi:hypothetical protein
MKTLDLMSATFALKTCKSVACRAMTLPLQEKVIFSSLLGWEIIVEP